MILIRNGYIVNEGTIAKGSVLIEGKRIKKIIPAGENFSCPSDVAIIDAESKYILPGVIDDQVHFREPGLTRKGDIASESKAAAAGGVTSFLDMPNTFPPATTLQQVEEKYELASTASFVNYGFYLGATNDNLEELMRADASKICGIKVFMGSSTGNLLVDNPASLEAIFEKAPTLVACHCEDEILIRKNLQQYRDRYGTDIPPAMHARIRDAEVCYRSSSRAVNLAKKYHTRLHLLHLSTAVEMTLLDNHTPLPKKNITAEVCVHHLWFCDEDYPARGNLIKWNPSIKSAGDRAELIRALTDGRIDIVATDHAPHTWEEKQRSYPDCPSGGPLIQHSLPAMLELVKKGQITLPTLVEKMCHAPATVFRIHQRGFLREGYYADITVVDMNKPWTVNKENILYKCGWSPFEGITFSSTVTHTLINGYVVYEEGKFGTPGQGMRLVFNA